MERNPANIPYYRRDCSWPVLDAIVRKSCLHVDVFLYDIDDQYYFFAEYRMAGHALLRTDCWRADYDPFGLPVFERVAWPVGAVMPDRAMPRHVNTPWARSARRSWLIQAARVLERREGWLTVRAGRDFKGLNSVRLHYVTRLEKFADPTAGAVNHYDTPTVSGRRGRKPKPGGRAEKKAERRKVERFKGALAQSAPREPAWNAKQRSLLRTLDKLIKY